MVQSKDGEFLLLFILFFLLVKFLIHVHYESTNHRLYSVTTGITTVITTVTTTTTTADGQEGAQEEECRG